MVALAIDEEKGLTGLQEAVRFCRDVEGRHGDLVRTMLSPDRIESCTPALLRRTADAGRELGVPVRLHCHQSDFEVNEVMRRHGLSPAAWLAKLGFLNERALLPHATHFPHIGDGTTREHDLALIRDAGATVVSCPVVMARHGAALDSLSRCRAMGLRVGLGTDTWPPDMILNMQVGLMLARVVDRSPDSVRSADLFDAATRIGADALGRPDLGRLQPGAMADIVVIDLGHDRIGPAIVVTHSQSGLFGWLAAARSPNAKAVVSYEPGVVFPQGQVPPPVPLFKGSQPSGTPVTDAEFARLASIPIQVVYGDNIPKQPIPDLVADGRRAQIVSTNQFTAALNSKGGDASVLHLPDAGLRGNSHFMFSDLNNIEVADQLSRFLRAKGLDTR